MPAWLNRFRSIRNNVALFLAITAACALGTVLPQRPEAPENVDLFLRAHPELGAVYKTLGFFDVYHSWWFLGMLGLMAFNIVVCKLGKVPPDEGLAALPPEFERERTAELRQAAQLKPFRARLVSSAGVDGARRAAADVFSRSGYAVWNENGGLSASRHGLQRWGSYIAHVALVVLLAGGLTKLLFGFEEMLPIIEGGSRPVAARPELEVALDRFTIEYYPGTETPKLFASEVRVLENGREIAQKRITVNDPLDAAGVRFYQASWGAGGMFHSATLRVERQDLVVPQRKPVPVPGLPVSVTADVLAPNFRVGEDGRAESESLDLKNPALRVLFEVAGSPTRPLWLLLNDPAVAYAENDSGILMRTAVPPFRVSAIDPVYFSGIQAGRDPGYPLVVAGSVAWLFGTILIFYLHRRRIWVVFTPERGAIEVTVGGWSSRGAREFQDEFDALVGRLKAALPAEPAGREVGR